MWHDAHAQTTWLTIDEALAETPFPVVSVGLFVGMSPDKSEMIMALSFAHAAGKLGEILHVPVAWLKSLNILTLNKDSANVFIEQRL